MAPEFLKLDWGRIFIPSQPILETIIRGTCMYLALFAMLRVFRRQVGALGPADFLVLLLIADAAQNGMADDYKSVTDGLILVATIMLWEYVIDWLTFRSPFWRKVLERSPRVLAERGVIDDQNLAQELMTREDLMSQLRQKGVEDPAVVIKCCLEGDGHVSVVAATDVRPGKYDQDHRPQA